MSTPGSARKGAAAISGALASAWKVERVHVVATIARRLGDLQRAEDAVQEAFAAAALSWARDGVPTRPGAWLTTTAWRKALDEQRRRIFPLLAEPDNHREPGSTDDGAAADVESWVTEDDMLALLLTCCHPALSSEAQVALTLRHVAGLGDDQIAAMLLIAPATLTKRLVRARAKIRDAGIPFGVPDRPRLHARLDELRTVIYLIFTEGYLSSVDGPAIRAELCDEAVWLAVQLHELLPHDDETTGLAALLLLHNARTAARQNALGEIVPYATQDRGQWDQAAIAQTKILLASTTSTPPGPYRVEAAIALLHAVAPEADAIDWLQITRLYDVLLKLNPTPVVAVNRAVAYGHAHHPQRGLALLEAHLADPRLSSYLPLFAAHARLLEDAGKPEAKDAWRHAATIATNAQQRRQLLQRADGQVRADSRTRHRSLPV